MEGVFFRESSVFFPTVVCLVAVVILLRFLQLSRVQPRNSPPGPFGLPVFGNLFQLGDSPHVALSEMAKVYGSVFAIRLGSRKAVVLNSQDVVKEALSKRAGHFSGRPHFHNFQISSIGGRSIAFGDSGPMHDRRKKLATRALHAVFGDVNRFNALTQQETERMCNKLKESKCKALDLTDHLSHLVINFSLRLVFGDDLKEDFEVALHSLILKANDFAENNAAINLLDFFPWLHFALRKQCKALKASVKELMDFVRNVYNLQRHRNVTEAGVNVAANLDRIIKDEMLSTGKFDAKNSKDAQAAAVPLDEESIVTMLAEVFGAGIETVSTTLTWGLLYILSDPELHHELQAELKREVGTDRFLTLEDRARMPLLQATVLEALRKASVFPLSLPHCTTENSSVAGYHIPKGTTVLVNLWAVNHDPKYFPNPDTFNPYRFLGEDGQVLKEQQAFSLPFSTGGRRCLGATLAKAELFMFLGGMLQRLNLQLPSSVEAPNLNGKLGLTLKPNPFKVIVQPKN